MKILKILRIVGIVAATLCFMLEITPYGIVISVANIKSYHSYFDISAWASGIIGPFFCGILTVAIVALGIGELFLKKASKHFSMTISIVSGTCVVFSFMPLLFDAYTLIGGMISALLLCVLEVNIWIYKKAFTK